MELLDPVSNDWGILHFPQQPEALADMKRRAKEHTVVGRIRQYACNVGRSLLVCRTIKLNNGVEMPLLGYGVFQIGSLKKRRAA